MYRKKLNDEITDLLFGGHVHAAEKTSCREDYGPVPMVIDLEKAALQNYAYRSALWTGDYLQLTLMSIPVGEDVGLEIHPDTDQFLYIIAGQGTVEMGKTRDDLDLKTYTEEGDAILVPAGTWHNLRNTAKRPLRFCSIYAPTHHPHCTLHPTREDAEADEQGY